MAWFVEWGDDDFCVLYPCEVSTTSSASSYGRPVVIIDGDPMGPADMPPGQIFVDDVDMADLLAHIGYSVDFADLDRLEELYETAEPDDDHWHPDARRVPRDQLYADE